MSVYVEEPLNVGFDGKPESPCYANFVGHGPVRQGSINAKTLTLGSKNALSGMRGVFLGLSVLALREAGPPLRVASVLRSTLGKR